MYLACTWTQNEASGSVKGSVPLGKVVGRQGDVVRRSPRSRLLELALPGRDALGERRGADADVGLDEVGVVQEHLDLERVVLAQEERIADVVPLRASPDVGEDAIAAEWIRETSGRR